MRARDYEAPSMLLVAAACADVVCESDPADATTDGDALFSASSPSSD